MTHRFEGKVVEIADSIVRVVDSDGLEVRARIRGAELLEPEEKDSKRAAYMKKVILAVTPEVDPDVEVGDTLVLELKRKPRRPTSRAAVVIWVLLVIAAWLVYYLIDWNPA